MYLYLWYFIIYAFIGWCTEVVYAAVSTGKLINRGFLNGPVCPIYGFGVLAVISLLTPVKNNLLLLYVGSVVLTSLIEFVTGWILEKAFNHKWWDYTEYPFNIKGYICLKFSLAWGTACLLIINAIHPLVQNSVSYINIGAGKIMLCIFLTIITVDVVATVQSVLKLNRQLGKINEVAAKIRSISDDMAEKISEESISIVEKGEELKAAIEEQKLAVSSKLEERLSEVESTIEDRKEVLSQKIEEKRVIIRQLKSTRDEMLSLSFFGERRLLNAFPGIKSKHYKEALEDLKEKILRK
ncbi:MAG: hypothetical protein K0Q47_353 [Sedimentibacter sp.]|jgi:uncharacterized membrane protein|nr:hypothetical protein [Sedimentibacter sp.]